MLSQRLLSEQVCVYVPVPPMLEQAVEAGENALKHKMFEAGFKSCEAGAYRSSTMTVESPGAIAE